MINSDVFRWSQLWPLIADAFKMPCGSIRPLQLADVMSERNEVWDDICRRNRLEKRSLDQVANWGFADATLERYWDEIFCHNKARKFGFDEWDNSISRFLSILEGYQNAKILPV